MPRLPAKRIAQSRDLATALAAVAWLVCGCGTSQPADVDAGPAFTPTFSNIDAQVFQTSCTMSGCHAQGAGATVGDLDLVTNPYAALVNVPAVDPARLPYQYGGKPLVSPGDPEGSLLYLKLTASSQCVPGASAQLCPDGEQMPSGNGSLPAGDIEAIREWIANGAPED